MIVYAFKQLKVHEKNYSTHDLKSVVGVILNDEGALTIRGQVCVPCVDDLVLMILLEVDCLRYSKHPGVTKMYRD